MECKDIEVRELTERMDIEDRQRVFYILMKMFLFRKLLMEGFIRMKLFKAANKTLIFIY